MAHFAITAIGSDRPGIVAGLTEALRDAGVNLEDVSSTILRGHFTMMFVVDAPEGTGVAELGSAMAGAADRLDVTVTVRDVEAAAPERPEATHAVTVYGADHPGIVAGIAAVLAEAGANITNLSCRLVGEDAPVYTMVAEVEAPEGADLEAAIAARAEELSVDVSVRPIEVETL